MKEEIKKVPVTATWQDDSCRRTNNATAVTSTSNKKGVPATATMANDNVFTNLAPVVANTPRVTADNKKVVITSAETIANIQKNLDSLCLTYQNSKNDITGFITALSKTLLLVQPEKGKDKDKNNDEDKKKENKDRSNYGTFVLQNGTKITIRVSNHRANFANFEKNDELEALSIVISRFDNGKREQVAGKSHAVEYFYFTKDLEEYSWMRPLAQIIQSMKQVLKNGEYIDTTHLAKLREMKLEKKKQQPVKIKKSHGPRL